MLLGPCSTDDDGNVCVRQPSGSFASIRLRTDLYRSGAGPLADVSGGGEVDEEAAT